MSAPAAVATGADVAKNAANPVLALKEADLKMMLAAKVHLGTKNADPQVTTHTHTHMDAMDEQAHRQIHGAVPTAPCDEC